MQQSPKTTAIDHAQHDDSYYAEGVGLIKSVTSTAEGHHVAKVLTAFVPGLADFAGELAPGHSYWAGWPLPQLVLPYHHAGRVEWTNLQEFPQLSGQLSGPGTAPRRIVFEVLSHDIDKVFRQYRWNDTFRCRILRIE